MLYTPPESMPTPGPQYLASGEYIDADAPEIRAHSTRATQGETTDVGKAVKLFYAVRDGWRYDPFNLPLNANAFKASSVLEAKGAFCITKAILLAALARAAGIPCALGFSDVVNHLSTEKLLQRMGGRNLFIYHGYAVMYLDGKWVKAAPAFNIELCERFGVKPTEFNGRDHAVYQEFDAQNRLHMQYVKDRGTWSDFPYEEVLAAFRSFYPATLFAEEDMPLFEDTIGTAGVTS